jgi:hypothetical protein
LELWNLGTLELQNHGTSERQGLGTLALISSNQLRTTMIGAIEAFPPTPNTPTKCSPSGIASAFRRDVPVAPSFLPARGKSTGVPNSTCGVVVTGIARLIPGATFRISSFFDVQ